jgi:hypothetical protein
MKTLPLISLIVASVTMQTKASHRSTDVKICKYFVLVTLQKANGPTIPTKAVRNSLYALIRLISLPSQHTSESDMLKGELAFFGLYRQLEMDLFRLLFRLGQAVLKVPHISQALGNGGTYTHEFVSNQGLIVVI